MLTGSLDIYRHVPKPADENDQKQFLNGNSGVQRSSECLGRLLDWMPPYQIL